MIPTEEMEEPVHDEHRHFFEERVASARGLFCGSWNADDHVTQDVRRDGRELALLHRERQYVRWFVFVAIGFVQLMDLIIVNKYD